MHFPVKATSTILFLRIKQVWRWLEFKIPPCSLNNGKSLNYPMYPRFCHEPPNLVLDIGTAEMLQVVGVWTNWNLKPLQQYQSTNNPERNPKRYTSHFCCAWCHDLKLESISIGSFLSLSLSIMSTHRYISKKNGWSIYVLLSCSRLLKLQAIALFCSWPTVSIHAPPRTTTWV